MAKNDFQKIDKQFIVLGIEKKKAKFFVVNNGSIQQKNNIENLDITNPTRGSYPSGIAYPRVDKVARHTDVHLRRFLKKVGKSVEKLSHNYPNYFIVLAGRNEIFHKLRDVLPEKINNKVKAKVKIDLDMPDNEILLKIRNLLVSDGIDLQTKSAIN